MGRAKHLTWGAWIAGGCAVYALLASQLPDPEPAAEHAESAGCSDHADATPDEHDCGLDAKAMLAKFQASIADKGQQHTLYNDPSGWSAVAGQVNVGLTNMGHLFEIAVSFDLNLVRTSPGHALLARRDGVADVRPLLAALRAHPSVRYAEPNHVTRVAWTPNDSFEPIMGQRSPELEAAWDVTQGDPSVIVAILDTGVDPGHPDLVGQLLPGYDVVNQTAVMSDDNGHGTAMAGIVGAAADNQIGVAGVAPGCRLLPIKVADGLGQASAADVAAGIDRALQGGARIINLSMGAPVGSQAIEDAVARAVAAGAVVVASAGNTPVNHEMFPAAYDGVLSTTAMSPAGELGFDAALAEGVDLGAPGEQLITTLPGDVYCFVSGSSAAAAYASGVAALCLSRSPTLTGPQLAHTLRSSQRPVAAFAGLEHVYRFGLLDPEEAVQRAAPGTLDVAIERVELFPRKPIPGQPAEVRVEVANHGNAPLALQYVRARLTHSTGEIHELGSVAVALGLGQRRTVSFPFTPSAPGAWTVEASAPLIGVEVDPGDNVRTLNATVDATPEADLRIVARRLDTPDLAQGSVTVGLTVENRGTAPAAGVTLRAAEVPASSTLGQATPTPLGPAQTVADLPVGAQASATFTYTFPTPAPTGIVRLRLSVDALPGETRADDNVAYLDLLPAGATQLRGLYQQSNGVDVISEAPWRVDPARTYVPLMIFVPSKGGRTSSTRLDVTRTTVLAKDTPTDPGTLVYDDRQGAPPTVAPAGLVVVDELGQARTTPDLFADARIDANGHHDILRLPRTALGVASVPGANTFKFLDTKVEWEAQRVLFSVFTMTRSGSHRSVSRVRFAPAPLPHLPGDNHHHDVHHHTIAEWYFGAAIDIFAPRKAYGGPLQMVFESGYAMGILDAPAATEAYMKIITTDHNCFNNRTIPNPDSPDHRPPYGPQSPALNPGVGQLEAYRGIFGDCAGEEVTFEQSIPISTSRLPSVIQPLSPYLPGLPLGAHMLTHNANHVEGAWHGGGWLIGPGNPRQSVVLYDLLEDLAQVDQANQGRAFSYAAHPFGNMGWTDTNFERTLATDPAYRTRDAVHSGSGEFVLKGLEFFNGRSTRRMENSAIDFNDLDPWVDARWNRPSQRWDAGVWRDMTRWHQLQSELLDYSFVSSPDTRFVRKLYHAGGSDAHGDFNFSVSRAATPLDIQSTYKVNDGTWYDVRTYCFGDDKAGGTPRERWLEAYADGNTVVTDGPLASLSLDADGRFDGATLRWHDGQVIHEDADGRIGGDGPLDGGFTALVRRGSDAPVFGYRYTSTDEWGPVASVLLYKTEAGNPNPTRTRGSMEQIIGVNELALGGADQDLEQRLDPSREGAVTTATAFSLGAFTVGNPDQVDIGPDGYRCYTNPVYAVPYDVTVNVAAVDSASGTIPAGALEVTWTFDISMQPTAPSVEVQGLDAAGDSAGASAPPLALMVPQSGSGWSDRPGVQSSVLTLVNQQPIPLGGSVYPAAGQTSFVVYWRDPPRDDAGNALNRIAESFASTHVPGGPTGPIGSVAPGATAGRGGPPPRSSSSGGCSMGSAPAGPAWPLWGLLIVALCALRAGATRGH